MPPFDYPEDRQRTSYSVLKSFMEGASLFGVRQGWLELGILPWMTARTAWVARIFGLEIWTLARIYAFLFGMATVALGAWAAWLAAGSGGRRKRLDYEHEYDHGPGIAHANAAGLVRQRRLALLFMAALAFNPYLIKLSRIITTEPVTLAFQMAAVAFFWATWRNGARARTLVPFAVFIILSGWAKLPSLIWLPGFFLYFMIFPQFRLRTRLAVAGVVALGGVTVLGLYGINPFTITASFAKAYPRFAGEIVAWRGSALWDASFWGRTVYMLTLPGAFFAVIGFLRAPWLFRITTLVFLGLFYQLNNLNTYNFCHIIIPGMALAAWGIDGFIEAGAAGFAGASGGATGAADRVATRAAWLRRVDWGLGAGLAALLVWTLYPLGPSEPKETVPRGEVLQAVEVFERHVPKGATIGHNDENDVFRFFTADYKFPVWKPKLDLSTGWYFSVTRFGTWPLEAASRAWVKWASLPGEPSGILMTAPGAGALARLPEPAGQYVRLQPSGVQPTDFGVEEFWLPAGLFDQGRNSVIIKAGSKAPLTLGITWKNSTNAPMAGLLWAHMGWKEYLPVPIRAGGLAVGQMGVLSIPAGLSGPVPYTFEIPTGFPTGTYTLACYAQTSTTEITQNPALIKFPFSVVVEAAEADAADAVADAAGKGRRPVTRPLTQCYLGKFDRPPYVWSRDWFYKEMALEGYRALDSMTYFFSCPGMPAGDYELTIEGEGRAVTSAEAPEGVWPTVEIWLPGSGGQAGVATVAIDSEKSAPHRVRFRAEAPFDSLKLVTKTTFGRAELPRWIINFEKEAYGQPLYTLRTVTLAGGGASN